MSDNHCYSPRESHGTKITGNSLFNVTMGLFDGAEVSELLVCLLLMTKIQQEIKCNIGLYRDDGRGIINNTPGETENP